MLAMPGAWESEHPQAGTHLFSLAEPRGQFRVLLSASCISCNDVHRGTVTGADSPNRVLWREEWALARLYQAARGWGEGTFGVCVGESGVSFLKVFFLTLSFVYACISLCEFMSVTHV